MYIKVQVLAIILLAYCIAEYDTLATGVWLVLVQIDSSYPHAHSRLILSLRSTG
jgi:hypothetical protein